MKLKRENGILRINEIWDYETSKTYTLFVCYQSYIIATVCNQSFPTGNIFGNYVIKENSSKYEIIEICKNLQSEIKDNFDKYSRFFKDKGVYQNNSTSQNYDFDTTELSNGEVVYEIDIVKEIKEFFFYKLLGN